eukprot:4955727-Amphidinium_carterae.1
MPKRERVAKMNVKSLPHSFGAWDQLACSLRGVRLCYWLAARCRRRSMQVSEFNFPGPASHPHAVPS